jgi:hypothetical protein
MRLAVSEDRSEENTGRGDTSAKCQRTNQTDAPANSDRSLKILGLIAPAGKGIACSLLNNRAEALHRCLASFPRRKDRAPSHAFVIPSGMACPINLPG